MSSALNLLDIPLLPLAHILKTMSIQDLLNLSYEQEIIQDFLKKIPIRSGGYKCTLNRHGIIIEMEKQSFTFNWNNDSIPDLLDVFDESFDHFDKVFPGGINKLEVCPIIFSEYIDRIPTECSILSIGEEIELEDIEDEEEYSDETLESLLNQTNFISGLILNASIRFEVTNDKMFNVDYLKIRNSEWMTSSSLERLQNKIIHLQNSYLMETEINSFLHNLKNGNGNKRLKVLTIESEEEEFDFTAVVNGLETIVTENQVYSMDKSTIEGAGHFLPFYLWRNIILHETHDFVTQDGRRVSIQSGGPRAIRIFVWKSKESRKRGNGGVDGPASKKHCSVI